MGTPFLEPGDQHASLKKMLNHVIAGSITVLVMAVIFGTFALLHLDRMVDQLELKTYDLRAQIQWGNPQQRPSSDVIILQFDDPSLNVFNDEYGVWPWPRDVHAHMIDFLNRAGVRSLLYDIMFVAHRKGSEAADAELINAFHKYNNVYLSMNFDNELEESRNLGKDLTPDDIELLKPLAINLKSELGTKPNKVIQLRRDPDGTLFFDNNHMTFNHYRSIMSSLLAKGSNIGIINHGAGVDGVSRSNPLFFRFQYQKFIRTQHSPIAKTEKSWMDAVGARTDSEGYLYAKTAFLPVVAKGNGIFTDSRPGGAQRVDEEGYLLDSYGNYKYQRDPKMSAMFFPYLGLRTVLDMKFPHESPEIRLTADGHLKFKNYDIPLNSNGDFLINWYNINVVREDYRKAQQELSAYRNVLGTQISQLEDQAKQPASPDAKNNILTELKKDRQLLQRVDDKYQRLEELLKTDYTPQPYRMVSAWEVLRTMKKEEKHLPLSREDIALKKLLKNKIVFVGATAVAAYDIKNTSIHPTLPGVILQANLFDNLYQNNHRYMHHVSPNVNWLATALICILAAGCAFRLRSALAGMLTSANIAILYVVLSMILYQYYQAWINIAMPLVALVITTTMTFMLKYFLRDKDYEKTYAMATTDSMTGLYNHRFFQDQMRLSIEQALRFKHKFSLVLIDIDFFKKFNDTYGHQAGDEVLRHVAKKLKKTVRNIDIVARYGGEEMAIILARATEEEALSVAQKVVKAVAEEAYPIAEGVAKHVTISCGVSTYPTHGQTPSQMIEFADAGLYRAKENGRNQVGAQYDAPTAPPPPPPPAKLQWPLPPLDAEIQIIDPKQKFQLPHKDKDG